MKEQEDNKKTPNSKPQKIPPDREDELYKQQECPLF